MKTLDQIKLTSNQEQVIAEFKRRLFISFDVVEMVIFGSVARGDADDESDLDMLIVTRLPLNRAIRHKITDIACEVNLQFDSNLSTLVIDQAAWQSGLYSILPIHQEILNEGVSV